MIQDLSVKADVVIAGGAVSSWWWLPNFDSVTHVLLVLGGLAIVGLRLVILWRELRKKGES